MEQPPSQYREKDRPVAVVVGVVVVTKLWEQQLIHFSCCEDNNNNNAAKKCDTEKEGLSSSELENV